MHHQPCIRPPIIYPYHQTIHPHTMDAAIRNHVIELDEQLARAQAAVDRRADAYAHKTETMEVPAQQAPADTVLGLVKALADPYLLILAAYLVLVAVQLILVSRSALQGKLVHLFRRPARVQVLAASAFVSLVATWYK